MPDIIFPASPSINDTYTFGGKTWVWNGYGWQLQISGAINNIPIGNVTPATGAFTTLSATGNITTAANISGGYLLGNGAFLTGLPAGYSNANVKAYLESGPTINANFGGGNISSTGTAEFGPTQVNGNLNVSGNIVATGNVTYISVQDLVISDPLIYLGADNPADLQDLGVVGSFNDGTYQHTGFVRDHTDDTWKVFTGVTTEPNTVVDWSQAVYAPFKSGAITSNASILANTTITAIGNIAGGNIISQAAISAPSASFGTLAVTGNATLGNINSNLLPAANVIYNLGSSNQRWNDLWLSNSTIHLGNAQVSANLTSLIFTNPLGGQMVLSGATSDMSVSSMTATGNISGAYFIGNGSQLTGLPAGYSNSDVANYLASNAAVDILTTANITTGANISGSYILGNGAYLTGIPAGYSNSDVSNYLSSNSAVTILTTANITTSSNISGGYILGNGAFLTGLPAGYSDANVKSYLESGNTINANFGGGNITTTGTATFGPTQINGNLDVAGNIIATGNITYTGINDLVVSNSLIYLGDNNVADLLDLGIVGTFVDGVNQYTGVVRDHVDDTWKVFTGVTNDPNTVIDWAQAVFAPFKAGDITSNANITANSNIAGSYILGNGAFLTGLPAGYSNSDVANYLSSNAAITVLTTSNITTSSNISGGYILGNGAFLTGIVAGSNYGNANVADYLASNASITISVGTGDITTQGNITGNYFIGNGAFLTGIVAGTSYSNSNVSDYLASNAAVTILTTSNITTAANISGDYILGNGRFLTGLPAGYSNTDVANYLASNSAITIEITGNITTSANISGDYILGNGRFLAGLPEAYGNANVKVYLESGNTINANFGGGNISTTGTATFGPTTVNGNLSIAGNILATGNITYISVQDLVITDPLIYLGEDNPADLQDLGLVASFTEGTYQHTGVVRDHTDNTWKVFTGVTTEPNTTVDWSQAVYAPLKSGAFTSNASILANTTITAVGNITGGNILTDEQVVATGNITGGNLIATANIISLGANITANAIVGNLSTAGEIFANGNITTNSYFIGNGAYLTGLPPVWSVQSANYTAVRNDGIFANTASSAFTVTLPASPNLGDTIYFCDSSGTWAINNLTINRNGGLIMNLSEDLVCDQSNTSFSLVFNGTSWRIV